MKVELNIETGEFGETFTEMFNNISKEKKEELATKVLEKWLLEPNDYERVMYTNSLINKVKSKNNVLASYGSSAQSNYWADKTDDEIRGDYDFTRYVQNNFKSTKEEMITNIISETTKFHKEEIVRKVKSDPQLEEIKEKVFEEVKNRFPEVILASFSSYINENLFSVVTDIGEKYNNLDTSINIIKQNLGINY